MPRRTQHRERVLERGTASVEAVIALPLFVILFVGIFFVRDLLGARLSADELARYCMWQYSVNSCNADHLPAECRFGEPSFDSNLNASISEIEDVLNQGVADLEGDPNVNDFLKMRTAAINVLQNTLLNQVAKYLTKYGQANPVNQVARPNLFGGGTSAVTARYRLPCNLEIQEQNNIAEQAWHSIMP